MNPQTDRTYRYTGSGAGKNTVHDVLMYDASKDEVITLSDSSNPAVSVYSWLGNLQQFNRDFELVT